MVTEELGFTIKFREMTSKEKDKVPGNRNASKTPLLDEEIAYVQSEIHRIEAMKLFLFSMIVSICPLERSMLLVTIRFMLREVFFRI